MVNWLKTYAATHVGYLVILAVMVCAGRLWLNEHDARTKADATVKTAQATIDGLQKQQTASAQAVKVQVVQLQAKADAVKTAPQAVQAIQTDAAIKQALPDIQVSTVNPELITVPAVDFYKAANKCEQTTAEETECSLQLGLQKQIDAQKDAQISALKQRPRFLQRLMKAAKVVGCAGAGAAMGGLTKQPMGAAIGGAVGAGVCQAF